MSKKPIYQPVYSNSWALIIGINEYEHASPLDYARNDAEAIRKILTERFQFPAGNITALIDKDAKRDAIREAFLKYAKPGVTQPDDRILVFFAGHGETVDGARGETGFLVPVDGKMDDLSTLIRWDELTRNAELVPAKHIFFLMDACYGGLALKRKLPPGAARFLKDMVQRFSRQVLTSGKADEPVADGSGPRPGHSIFTGHLLNGLEGGAATQAGIITASSLMAYTHDRVGTDHYSAQTPHYGFIDGDGDFIFDTTPLQQLQSEQGKEDKDVWIEISPQEVAESATDNSIAGTVKKLLSDPAQKINLDSYVTSHVRRAIAKTTGTDFPPHIASVTTEDIINRLKLYEDRISDAQTIATLLARWANQDQLLLLKKLLTRIGEVEKPGSGQTVWLSMAWYPSLLLTYAAGITALSADRYDSLAIALTTEVHSDSSRSGQSIEPVVLPIVNGMLELDRLNVFKNLPGHEQNYTPRSEYLYKQLQPLLEDTLFLGRGYENLFDRFEILYALIYADLDPGQRTWPWAPPGRFAWKHRSGIGRRSPYTNLIEEAKRLGDEWPVSKAGLFQGSTKRFLEIAEGYLQKLNQLNWF